MKQNQQISKWLKLATLLTLAWAAPQAPAAIITVTSVQTGNWEDSTTWDCGCVPGPGNSVVIATGTTVKINGTTTTGNVTVNGALDLNDQFFEFEGTTFRNAGSVVSSTGGFGEIDFAGLAGVASTTQTISGTGSYSGGGSLPVEIHVNNNTTLTPASGTNLNNVRTLYVSAGATLSLGNVLIFQNGTVVGAPGGSTISGAGGLQTKNTTTLNLTSATTAPIEIVNGTTTCVGFFGPITVDSGATLLQGGTVTANGDITVNGTLDTNDQFFEFQGTTFANNGAVVSGIGSFGEIDFVGLGGVASTTQAISGTGSYSGGPSFPVEIHVNNNATLAPASGTNLNNVRNLNVSNGATLSLGNVLIFQNGTVVGAPGGSTISGAGGLQTKNTTTLNLTSATTAPIEIVNGTTTCVGFFGPITVDSGATLLQGGTVTANGDITVNGTLDTNDQFFEFQGTTFANNGAVVSGIGSFGEIDFVGLGGVASTTQAISGTGSYSGGPSFPVEIHVNNNATLAPASGTNLNNVRNLNVSNGATLSLGNVLIFQNGTLTAVGGSTISGASGLQTKNTTTLSLSGTTTALIEIVNGTTTGAGNFGPVTVDSGATFFQNGTDIFNGDLNVKGTLDMNNQFGVFQGTTFTNNGAMISSTPFGIFEFNGVAGAAATAQNIAGTGTYNTNGRIDFHAINGAQVAVVNGAALEGLVTYTIDNGCSFTNHGTIAPGFPPGTLTDSGPITLASNSTLAFAIGGTTAGTDYDVFNKVDGGTQTLDGVLSLTLTGGFVPDNTDIFTIMTTQTMIAGTFTNVANGARLDTTDGGGSFKVTWTVVNNATMSQNITLSDFQPSVKQVPTGNEVIASGTIAPHISFSFNAVHGKKNKVNGSISYSDPDAGVSFSTKISALSIRQNQITCAGQSKGGKKTRFSFTIHAVDNGEPGTNDTFSITTSTGYSASGRLTSGDITLEK